jgi:hypothetical protein
LGHFKGEQHQRRQLASELLGLLLAAIDCAGPVTVNAVLDALDGHADPRQSRRDQKIATRYQHSHNHRREHRPTPQCSKRYVRLPPRRCKREGRLIAPIDELLATLRAQS